MGFRFLYQEEGELVLPGGLQLEHDGRHIQEVREAQTGLSNIPNRKIVFPHLDPKTSYQALQLLLLEADTCCLPPNRPRKPAKLPVDLVSSICHDIVFSNIFEMEITFRYERF